jgi:hypothetical protein
MASQLEMNREIVEMLKAINVRLETQGEINGTNNEISGAIRERLNSIDERLGYPGTTEVLRHSD